MTVEYPISQVPDLSSANPVLNAAGRDVQVLLRMQNPRIVVFGNLLSPEECAILIALAVPRLGRSTVVKPDGEGEINPARTSDGMFFNRGEHPVVRALEERASDLLNWPIEYGEGLQILRYSTGAEYLPHYDYFDPAKSGSQVILRRGGQRVGSLICYLKVPELGGETVFPDVQLGIVPVVGSAVFFSYNSPHPGTRSLHGGAPVFQGEKWVATKWFRQSRFD